MGLGAQPEDIKHKQIDGSDLALTCLIPKPTDGFIPFNKDKACMDLIEIGLQNSGFL